jgi:hypothetical protein
MISLFEFLIKEKGDWAINNKNSSPNNSTFAFGKKENLKEQLASSVDFFL